MTFRLGGKGAFTAVTQVHLKSPVAQLWQYQSHKRRAHGSLPLQTGLLAGAKSA